MFKVTVKHWETVEENGIKRDVYQKEKQSEKVFDNYKKARRECEIISDKWNNYDKTAKNDFSPESGVVVTIIEFLDE